MSHLHFSINELC